jgi:MFS transporter, MFS domain-containing protein family, molybdate-anion transporter
MSFKNKPNHLRTQNLRPLRFSVTQFDSRKSSSQFTFSSWDQTGSKYPPPKRLDTRDMTILTGKQGAYVYTLYKDEKGLAEPVVAVLFTSGFLAAAVSAFFAGSLADRYGRRLACLVFCVSYAVSCLTKISDDVLILFIGRLLGGLSTTLMYSVFESWMVTEYYAQRLDKSSMSLSALFGIMTTLNSIVAILSGVLGEGLVLATKTKVSPFMASIVCLGIAFWLITQYWVGPFCAL